MQENPTSDLSFMLLCDYYRLSLQSKTRNAQCLCLIQEAVLSRFTISQNSEAGFGYLRLSKVISLTSAEMKVCVTVETSKHGSAHQKVFCLNYLTFGGALELLDWGWLIVALDVASFPTPGKCGALSAHPGHFVMVVEIGISANIWQKANNGSVQATTDSVTTHYSLFSLRKVHFPLSIPTADWLIPLCGDLD